MDYSQTVGKVLGELGRALSQVDRSQVEEFLGQIGEGGRIFCDGAGRSRLQAQAFAMRLAQMGFDVHVVGEATAPAIRQGDTLLVLSGSGETPALVEHARKARQLKAAVLAVTTAAHSPLAALSDRLILIRAARKDQPSGPSAQPMGTLFEQSAGLLCDAIVLLLMEQKGITSAQMYQNHSNLE